MCFFSMDEDTRSCLVPGECYIRGKYSHGRTQSTAYISVAYVQAKLLIVIQWAGISCAVEGCF